MDDVLERILANFSEEDRARIFFNARQYQLNRKAHIKKYNKFRKLQSEVIDSMENYILDGKYDMNKYLKDMTSKVNFDKLKDKRFFNFDYDDPDDRTILDELFIYKNIEGIPSVTEIYLEKNKLRNEDKVKMLNAMNNSYVSLFKIVGVDMDEAYVIYEDVFTKKRYKIIDIAMSGSVIIDKKRPIYYYNRIITIDGISYGTGIHCIMTGDNKELINFIKKHDYKKSPDFYRCLMLYDISKKEKNMEVSYNNRYGYR